MTPGTLRGRKAAPAPDRAAGTVPSRQLLALLRGATPELTAHEWDRVVDEAVRHRVAPLLYRALRQTVHVDVPAAVLHRLHDVYTRATLHAAHLMRELSSVFDALSARGIETMALKGAALSLAVYPEPALRSMADLDVLVPRTRLADAERALLDVGYGPEPRPDIDEYTSWCQHIAPLVRAGGARVEVHWTIERPASPFSIDIEAVWRRARPIDSTVSRLLPAPEDMLVHACIHAAYHHRFDRAALKQLCDVAAIVERFRDGIDWQLVARIARDTRTETFVRCTLLLAQDLRGVAIPGSALDSVRRAPGEDALLGAARNYILTPPEELPSAYGQLARRTSLSDRLRLVAETLFPGRAVIASLHGLPPESHRWYLYAAVRPFELLLRRGRIGARILLRSRQLRPALQRESDRRRIYRWVDDADAAGGEIGPDGRAVRVTSGLNPMARIR